MNSLKNLLFLVILSAVAWGVYVTLSRPPEAAGPPPQAAPQTPPDAPRVEIPNLAIPTTAPTPVGQAATTTPAGQATPPAPSADMAPPFAPSSASSAGSASSPPASAADVRHDQTSPTSMAPPFATTTSPAAPPFVPSASPGPPPARRGPRHHGPVKSLAPVASNRRRGFHRPKADATVAATTNWPPAAEKNTAANEKITSLLTLARTKLDEGHIAEAHLLLSPLCREPGAPPELMRLLDQMAGVVIYSRQHLLEPPYQIQPGDTLERIAEALNVPAILLARINGVRDSESLRPGRELKVLRGPFSAVIDLGKSELTLMLRDRYAGRFPVTFISPGRLEGSYKVISKQGTSPSDARGGSPAAGYAANSLGALYWIDLGNGIGIGRNRETPPSSVGSIGLGDRDIDDVYGILSNGSSVTIQGRSATSAADPAKAFSFFSGFRP